MSLGKDKCAKLKEIRRAIAANNGVELTPFECNYQGECTGTCPHCEGELHYLERELVNKQRLGNAVVMAGVSVSLIAGMDSCVFKHITETRGVVPADVPPVEADSTHNMEPYALGIILKDDSTSTDEYPILTFEPTFPGGEMAMLSFISDNLQFSKYVDGAQGAMVIGFTVDAAGHLSNIEVTEGISEGLDADVKRVFGIMPAWERVVDPRRGDDLSPYNMVVVVNFPIELLDQDVE